MPSTFLHLRISFYFSFSSPRFLPGPCARACCATWRLHAPRCPRSRRRRARAAACCRGCCEALKPEDGRARGGVLQGLP